jgi:hypothetical protein
MAWITRMARPSRILLMEHSYITIREGHAETKFREAEKAELLELASAVESGDKMATH